MVCMGGTRGFKVERSAEFHVVVIGNNVEVSSSSASF